MTEWHTWDEPLPEQGMSLREHRRMLSEFEATEASGRIEDA